jgi:anti-sigma factor (TIGR02949 family)
MGAPELTCVELVAVVTEYLDGALSPEDRARFDDHLAECDGCSAYLDQMRQAIRLAGSLSEDAIPADARDALLRAFRGWKASR